MFGYFPSLSETEYAFRSVYIGKMLHDSGRLEKYLSYGVSIEADCEYEAIVYGLFSVMEKVWSRESLEGLYDQQIETFYFSDSLIMEYYRLCRVYGKRHGIKLADNPYMREAKRYVDDRLDQGCPACDYRLQTKINQEWGSGIIFHMWPEFEWRFELLILINEIRGFYAEQLEKLKKELWMGADTKKQLREAA